MKLPDTIRRMLFTAALAVTIFGTSTMTQLRAAAVEDTGFPAPLPEWKTPAQLKVWRAETTAKTLAKEAADRAAQVKVVANSATPSGFYTGKPYMAESGTYAFKYREYNPEMARWTTVDPSGFPDGANNRVYAAVPTSQIDDNGLTVKPTLDFYSTSWTTTVNQGVSSTDVIGMIDSLTSKTKITSLTLGILEPYIESLLGDNMTESTTITNLTSEDILSANPKLVTGFPKPNQNPRFSFSNKSVSETVTLFLLNFSTTTEYRWTE